MNGKSRFITQTPVYDHKRVLHNGTIRSSCLLLQKAQENLNQKENKVYEAKINIIYELFQKTPEESVNQCRSYIHFLFEQNDADSVHDLALIISQYYEARGYIQEALEFSNHAILAERKMKQLEEFNEKVILCLVALGALAMLVMRARMLMLQRNRSELICY